MFPNTVPEQTFPARFFSHSAGERRPGGSDCCSAYKSGSANGHPKWVSLQQPPPSSSSSEAPVWICKYLFWDTRRRRQGKKAGPRAKDVVATQNNNSSSNNIGNNSGDNARNSTRSCVPPPPQPRVPNPHRRRAANTFLATMPSLRTTMGL